MPPLGGGAGGVKLGVSGLPRLLMYEPQFSQLHNREAVRARTRIGRIAHSKFAGTLDHIASVACPSSESGYIPAARKSDEVGKAVGSWSNCCSVA